MTTPKEQLAKYSTQLTYSTHTSPTYHSLLSEVDMTLPNAVASSDKIAWMNDSVKRVWPWVSSTKWYQTTTVADQAIYPMSTDMRFEGIKRVFISDSTARSTTEEYTELELAHEDDTLSGFQYYKAGHGIGIYPVPSTLDYDNRALNIAYEPIPANYSSTADTTTVLPLHPHYGNLIVFDVCSRVAKAGNNPDVDLANNYTMEYRELLRDAKRDYYNRHKKKRTWSYKEGWWNG